MTQNDKYGRHECLDRTSIIMNMIGGLLLEHEGLTKKEFQLAEAAHDSLFNLYQMIGKGK